MFGLSKLCLTSATFCSSIGFCLLVALGAERLSSAFSSLHCRAFMRRRPASAIPSKKRKRSPSQSSMSSTSSLSSNSSSLSSKKSSRRTTRQKIRLRRRLRSGEEGVAHTNVYFLALFSTLLLLFALKTWTRNYDWNSRRDLFR